VANGGLPDRTCPRTSLADALGVIGVAEDGDEALVRLLCLVLQPW
jgi:hypothetical protein